MEKLRYSLSVAVMTHDAVALFLTAHLRCSLMVPGVVLAQTRSLLAVNHSVRFA